MKKLIIAAALFLTACNTKPIDIPSGSIYHLPMSSKYALGTDSTVVIVDRETGEITTVIDRKGYAHE
jgi:hypothetical protein